MEKLSDYKPLERIVLAELGALECSGLTLLVGPNSSGKTQLLRDIHERLRGAPRALVVARQIDLQKPEWGPFLSCLEREGYVRVVEENKVKHIRPTTTYVGTGEFPQPLQVDQAWGWYGSTADNQWLNYFGRFLITSLFLERRFLATAQVGILDFETQPPQQDLHALYLNDDAKKALFDELRDTFGTPVWPDTSRGTLLSLRVSSRRDAPTEEDRLSPQKMMAYRTIESEGDGLKSYVATCIALLLGRRPVCLVDEPEMCLHPPQAYHLGRFIGRFGSSADHATFVATHSSHVLRGVIEARPQKLQIVRLVRRGEDFEAHVVQSATLADALKRPAARAESMLDGIFSQAVVVLEADTDRTVYQAALETLREEIPLDIYFATVGGSGGIADTCHLYRTLRIPIAAIADLDLLVDRERLKQVLTRLVDDDTIVRPLVDRAADIGDRIKLIPPTVTPVEVQCRLKGVLSAEMDWSKKHDTAVAVQLRKIANDLDRMKRLKRGGIASLPLDLQEAAKKIIEDLSRCGLFLVPVGELEQWLAHGEVSVSKENKWGWANAAAAYILGAGPRDNGVWQFVKGVARFFNQ
jgi:hypothetical protein